MRPSRVCLARPVFLVLGLGIFTGLASGQSVGLPAPRLLTMTPMGARVGTEVDVAITGEHLEDAGDLIFSDPRIIATPGKDKQGQILAERYLVRVAPDCPPGLYEARIMTRLGISSSRIFSVGNLPEVSVAKPNLSMESSVELTLPSICNARVTDRSIDHFHFQAKAGQKLVIDCSSRGIDSKLDPTVIVADARGRDLLVERRGGALKFVVPADGLYRLKIHDLTFKGGPAYFYRLGIWQESEGLALNRQPSTQPVHAFSWPPTGLAQVSPWKEETRPSSSKGPQIVTLPCDVSGSFFPAADVDEYQFEGKKGEQWWIEVASERLGRPTDPFVLVQKVVKDRQGGMVTYQDILELNDVPSPIKVSSNGYAYDGPPYNAGTSDPMGKLTIPEDGTYRLRISDQFGGTRNDPSNIYRLIIRKAAPDFALVAWAMHMELRNGDRNALSKPLTLRGGATMALEVVAFRRDGFDGPIDLFLEGLPPGVQAQGLTIPSGQSRGMMLLTASETAPRGYANARFVGRATIGGAPVDRPCRLASVAWPIPDSWGEIPWTRLLLDVPVSVGGKDLAPLTITPGQRVVEIKTGEKLSVPLVLKKRETLSGDKIEMKVIGHPFDQGGGFDLPLKSEKGEWVIDLTKRKVKPGDYHLSFLGGAVVKYRHNPDQVVALESQTNQTKLEIAKLESEIKKLSTEVDKAPAPQKEEMKRTMDAMNRRMKKASDAFNLGKERLKRASQDAQPRDIADIFVCEPITLRVKEAGK